MVHNTIEVTLKPKAQQKTGLDCNSSCVLQYGWLDERKTEIQFGCSL